jgi:hypothetical protein
MVYRLVGRAEHQIDRILLASASEWGIKAAGRYHRSMLAAMAAVGDKSATIPCFPDLETSHALPA